MGDQEPAEQFGRKSGKSAYHCATLVGPWEEERRQFGLGLSTKPLNAAEPIDAMTTYKESFLLPTSQQIVEAKPPSCFAAEAPRELMFYHGDLLHPVKSQIPLTELSWSDRKKEPYTSPETLDIMGISRRQTGSNAIRRELGVSGASGSAAGGGGGGGGGGDVEAENAAVVKESDFLRSLQNPHGSAKESGNDSGYRPPSLPPIGRVAERNRLLTTKQVTLDSVGCYLKKNPNCYPATSSDVWGQFMKNSDNVMHKTNLRVEWEDE
eukprot:gene7240-5089_t